MNDKLSSLPSQGARSDDEEQRRKELLRLLQSWLEEDEKEQVETLSYLKQALDEDRLSDRKLFS